MLRSLIHTGAMKAMRALSTGLSCPPSTPCAVMARTSLPSTWSRIFSVGLPELVFEYHGTPIHETNNGHTIMLKVSGESYLDVA